MNKVILGMRPFDVSLSLASLTPPVMGQVWGGEFVKFLYCLEGGIMQKFSEADLDKYLLYVLNSHVGKEKAVERWDLVETVFGEHVPAPLRNDDHPQDRDIRYAIGRLRKQGHLICDLGDGNGRYLAATEAEFWELYNYYVKPIKARAEVARAMRKAAIHRWPNALQYSMFNTDELEMSV
jgi:hypothetical protein